MIIKILNLLALFFQFLAFWLAAPEILGAEWIEKTESFSRSVIKKIPSVILAISGILAGVITAHSIENIYFVLPVFIGLALFMKFSKNIEDYLDLKISKPLLSKLIIDQNFRFTLLKIAALFFTIGFLIQVTTTILS